MSVVTPVVEEMAGDLLDIAKAAILDIGHAVPDRVLVAHSDLLAYDCEQLTVHAGPLRPKVVTDPQASGCMLSWVARLTVVLLRCVTALTEEGIPPAATLDVENRQLIDDGEALARYLSRQWATEAWPAGGSCSDVTWYALDPVPPQGCLAGWRLPVDVQL